MFSHSLSPLKYVEPNFETLFSKLLHTAFFLLANAKFESRPVHFFGANQFCFLLPRLADYQKHVTQTSFDLDSERPAAAAAPDFFSYVMHSGLFFQTARHHQIPERLRGLLMQMHTTLFNCNCCCRRRCYCRLSHAAYN